MCDSVSTVPRMLGTMTHESKGLGALLQTYSWRKKFKKENSKQE